MGLLHDLNTAGLTAAQIIAAVKAVERFGSSIGAGTVTVTHDGKGAMVIAGEPSGTFVDVARAGIIQKGAPRVGYGIGFRGDFTTAQYWVGSATQGVGFGVGRFQPTSDPNYSPAQDLFVPATNLAEWDIDGGTHLLDPGQAVILFHLVAPDGADYYVFSLEPDTDVISTIITGPGLTDNSGEYKGGAIVPGEPTGMPTAGQTVPMTSDAVIENAPEATLINPTGAGFTKSHWAVIGPVPPLAYPAAIIGTTTDNPPKKRLFTSIPNPFTVFFVQLTPYSMSGDGNATMPPMYQYIVKDGQGNLIGDQMNPLAPRPNGSFIAAGATGNQLPGVSFGAGLAFYDVAGVFGAAGTLQLLYAYELPNTNTCP